LWRKLNCKYISLPDFVAKFVDDFFLPVCLVFPSVGVITILFNRSSSCMGFIFDSSDIATCGLSYNFDISDRTFRFECYCMCCPSCLLDFYRVRHLIKVELRPNLILAAEKELGIVAGLQDRVAQVYGGLVYMVSDLNF
jgi:hypothetical protein